MRLFRSLFDALARPRRQRGFQYPSKRFSFRPALEALECREVLSAVVAIAPSGLIANASPTFRWNALAGADHYEVWVDDQTTQTSAIIRNEGVFDTSWTPTAALTPGDTYRWWVRGIDPTNTFASDWSSPLDFTISFLSAPTPIGPTGSLTSAAPTFTWTAAARADHYDIWVDDLTTKQSQILR